MIFSNLNTKVLQCVRLSSLRQLSTLPPPKPGRAQFNLQNKVALVTASTEGIGFAIAQRFAQSGASVIISSRKQKNVDKALEQLNQEGLTNVQGMVCHVGKKEDRENLRKFIVDKHEGLDILVSNAAVNPAMGGILDTEESIFDKIYDINVKSAFMLTKEFVPHMANRKGDKAIVYISSIAGYQIMPLISTYSASKTALLGLMRAVAMHCSEMESGIRVNCVCPGIIKTKFSDQLTNFGGFQEEFNKVLLIKRMGESPEIASLVTFLCSEEASYISGENFVASGGMYSRV